ncbi:MAG: hypothetical protein KGL53_00650, partial [Elusimicrobia bacterium]|nr:hypothetical protein [Elusimicrobiota bacterium]
MPTPREFLGAAAVGGRVFAFGGDNTTITSPLAVNEEFDPESNTWAARAPMLNPRDDMAGAVLDGKAYAMGGYVGASLTTANEAYDPSQDAWSARASLPVAQGAFGAAALDGRIYAVGLSGTGLSAYDPLADAWTPRHALPESRSFLSAAAAGGKLYAIGGDAGGVTGLNEEYDPTVDSWTVRQRMPTSREYLAAAAVGGKVFAVGGTDGFVALSAVESYDPGTAQEFGGLAPNTLYAFKGKARNRLGVETAEVTGSTYTLALATGPVLFTGVFQSSVTVTWSDGGGGANPESFALQASTMPSFVPFASSTAYTTSVGLTTATLAGLPANTTVYLRVQAYNAAGLSDYSWFVLGSTVTAIETPTAIVFDDISSTTITAVAYSSGTAFSSMTVGASGTDEAVGGVYAGWHGEGWSTIASLPTARYRMGAAAAGGRLYAIWGSPTVSLTVSSVTEVYDPQSNSWAEAAAWTPGRFDFDSVALGGKVYAVGGYDPAQVSTTTVYDVA